MAYFVVFLAYKRKFDSNMFHFEHCFSCKLLIFVLKK